MPLRAAEARYLRKAESAIRALTFESDSSPVITATENTTFKLPPAMSQTLSEAAATIVTGTSGSNIATASQSGATSGRTMPMSAAVQTEDMKKPDQTVAESQKSAAQQPLEQSPQKAVRPKSLSLMELSAIRRRSVTPAPLMVSIPLSADYKMNVMARKLEGKVPPIPMFKEDKDKADQMDKEKDLTPAVVNKVPGSPGPMSVAAPLIPAAQSSHKDEDQIPLMSTKSTLKVQDQDVAEKAAATQQPMSPVPLVPGSQPPAAPEAEGSAPEEPEKEKQPEQIDQQPHPDEQPVKDKAESQSQPEAQVPGPSADPPAEQPVQQAAASPLIHVSTQPAGSSSEPQTAGPAATEQQALIESVSPLSSQNSAAAPEQSGSQPEPQPDFPALMEYDFQINLIDEDSQTGSLRSLTGSERPATPSETLTPEQLAIMEAQLEEYLLDAHIASDLGLEPVVTTALFADGLFRIFPAPELREDHVIVDAGDHIRDLIEDHGDAVTDLWNTVPDIDYYVTRLIGKTTVNYLQDVKVPEEFDDRISLSDVYAFLATLMTRPEFTGRRPAVLDIQTTAGLITGNIRSAIHRNNEIKFTEVDMIIAAYDRMQIMQTGTPPTTMHICLVVMFTGSGLRRYFHFDPIRIHGTEPGEAIEICHRIDTALTGLHAYAPPSLEQVNYMNDVQSGPEADRMSDRMSSWPAAGPFTPVYDPKVIIIPVGMDTYAIRPEHADRLSGLCVCALLMQLMRDQMYRMPEMTLVQNRALLALTAAGTTMELPNSHNKDFPKIWDITRTEPFLKRVTDHCVSLQAALILNPNLSFDVITMTRRTKFFGIPYMPDGIVSPLQLIQTFGPQKGHAITLVMLYKHCSHLFSQPILELERLPAPYMSSRSSSPASIVSVSSGPLADPVLTLPDALVPFNFPDLCPELMQNREQIMQMIRNSPISIAYDVLPALNFANMPLQRNKKDQIRQVLLTHASSINAQIRHNEANLAVAIAQYKAAYDRILAEQRILFWQAHSYNINLSVTNPGIMTQLISVTNYPDGPPSPPDAGSGPSAGPAAGPSAGSSGHSADKYQDRHNKNGSRRESDTPEKKKKRPIIPSDSSDSDDDSHKPKGAGAAQIAAQKSPGSASRRQLIFLSDVPVRAGSASSSKVVKRKASDGKGNRPVSSASSKSPETPVKGTNATPCPKSRKPQPEKHPFDANTTPTNLSEERQKEFREMVAKFEEKRRAAMPPGKEDKTYSDALAEFTHYVCALCPINMRKKGQPQQRTPHGQYDHSINGRTRPGHFNMSVECIRACAIPYWTREDYDMVRKWQAAVLDEQEIRNDLGPNQTWDFYLESFGAATEQQILETIQPHIYVKLEVPKKQKSAAKKVIKKEKDEKAKKSRVQKYDEDDDSGDESPVQKKKKKNNRPEDFDDDDAAAAMA